MNIVNILDCTLRDGGYCNNWNFGNKNIKKVLEKLVEANINVIECGFLTNKVQYNPEQSKFNSVEQIANILPLVRSDKIFVAMINYGECNINSLTDYNGSSVDGIRVAFHKKDFIPALEFCKEIKDKGYKVFVQPMLSLNYSDMEFLKLIDMTNNINPYAFYIVDSFGMMKRKDLIRLYYMVEHNLNEDIWIGFHSHNNMQLAYSNAQALTSLHTNRNLLIDTSVYGMGRGAGNLNTELFTEYLNDNYKQNYNIKPLLNIIDEILNYFHAETYWGYSLPNYISAIHNAHPNYAGFLSEKNTLTIENINDIFCRIDDEKKSIYDKEYIEDLYLTYMQEGNLKVGNVADISKKFRGRNIVLIAPGKKSIKHKLEIQRIIEEKNAIAISINFEYDSQITDYIFVSNIRRFSQIDNNKRKKCIVTSNIKADDVCMRISYKDVLSSREIVKDNAGLMAIKMLIDCGASCLFLAGFDGYSYDNTENYVDNTMKLLTQRTAYSEMNEGMKIVLDEYAKKIKIMYITESRYANTIFEEV